MARKKLLKREYLPVWSDFSMEVVNKTILVSDFGVLDQQMGVITQHPNPIHSNHSEYSLLYFPYEKPDRHHLPVFWDAFRMSTNKKEDFYVYVLIDPTNDDQPFYVGKGIGNRAEDHLSKNPEDPREKAQRIDNIRSQNQKPYVRRVMWNLDENTAFAVETALINTLPDLLNIIRGQKLSSVRRKRKFPDWVAPYPGVDISMYDGNLDVLDSENPETCYFLSKLDAYNAAGSKHKSAKGSYHIHTECKIRMWTGNLLDPYWVNEYDPKTGDYFIGLEKVMERHKTWEKIICKHNKLTRHKIKNDNKFLCFTKGLSPNNYIKFLGVYEDNWEESKRQERIVRKRVSTKWKIP